MSLKPPVSPTSGVGSLLDLFAQLAEDNDFTGRMTLSRDLETLRLEPPEAADRLQIQWQSKDLQAKSGSFASNTADVVSLDVHGAPHHHIELYTLSGPTAVGGVTLIKRFAINYGENAPIASFHGTGLTLEGASTAEVAAGGEVRIELNGTKTTSRWMNISPLDNNLRWIDVGVAGAGPQVNRMALDMSNGDLTLHTGNLVLDESGKYIQWAVAANTQLTVGAAGAASALPATPSKYLKVKDNAGTVMVIPAYAVS